MALTRNDKMLILAAVALAASVVGGLAWWRTSGRQAEPVATPAAAPAPAAGQPERPVVQQAIQLPPAPPQAEVKVQPAPGTSPAVTAPLAQPPAAEPPDQSLQTIFAEEPKPAPSVETPPPAPPAPPVPAVEPPAAAKPQKPETRAERKARLAAERKAEAQAKRAEEDAAKARAETLRRAQEELRKAEAELKLDQEKAAKIGTSPEASPKAAPAAKPEAGPEAKPEAKPGATAPDRAPAAQTKPAPEHHVVDKITVSESGQETVYILHGASTASRPETLLMAAPPRLVIDLPGAWVYQGGDKVDSPLVKALRVGKYPDKIRLVFDLASSPNGPKHPLVENGPQGLEIRLPK